MLISALNLRSSINCISIPVAGRITTILIKPVKKEYSNEILKYKWSLFTGKLIEIFTWQKFRLSHHRQVVSYDKCKSNGNLFSKSFLKLFIIHRTLDKETSEYEYETPMIYGCHRTPSQHL